MHRVCLVGECLGSSVVAVWISRRGVASVRLVMRVTVWECRPGKYGEMGKATSLPLDSTDK